MAVAASSAVPSRLLLLTTRQPSSKYRHLVVGAQFGCGFEMSVGGLENVCIIKPQVLCSASPWFSPVAPGSPTAARYLAAARIIAGFFDRDISKWLFTRRRLAFNFAIRLVQKWFRGVRFSRLALRLLAPFVGSECGEGLGS